MDNQVDPVAQLADEAGGSAPQLDKAVRKSSATKAESEQDTPAEKQASIKVESGSEAQPSASSAAGASSSPEVSSAPSAGAGIKSGSTATTVQAETRTAQAETKTTQAETKTTQAETQNGSSGKADAASPASFAKVQDAKRTDATIPKAAVPRGFTATPDNAKPDNAKPDSAKPESSRPEGNGRPDVPAKPLGASAADTIAAPVRSAAVGSPANRPAKADDAAQEAESTSTLAAAALARELTGAGFASPGFASPDLSQARPASPSGAQRSSTAETNPWVSPASTGGQPSSRPSVWTPASSTKAQAATTQAATTQAATTQAATAQGAAAQAAPAQPATAQASAQPATAQPATAQASAASGTAAPPRPAYSPTGAPPTGGQAESVGVGQTATAHAPEPYSAPSAAQAVAASVRSASKKAKVGSPFARPGKKNKLKPSAVRRPGGAIGNGKSAVTVKSKPGALRSPAAQAGTKGVRSDGAEARDAQLVLSRIEPWSVMKFSFMVSLIGWLVLFVAVAVIYFAFSSLGVFHSIEQTIGLVTSSNGNPGSNAASWFSAGTVLGYTMLAGAIDVILITALATVGAVVYNAVTRLTGGVEITLQEAD